MPFSLSSYQNPDVAPGAPRVVVAEDDDAFRNIICSVLRGEGYLVQEARNGAELFHLVASNREPSESSRLDLIVSTTTLPGNGGIGMLLGIHTHLQGIPLILITRTGESRTQVLVPRRGEMAVNSRPFVLNDLQQLVRGLVDRTCAPVVDDAAS